MSGEVFRRVKSGFGANSANQFVTVLSQLVLVPWMLQFWGSGLYAEWLVIFTIPSYFAIADIGIGTAAGNQICLLSSNQSYDEANRTFQSAGLGLLLIGTVVTVCLGLSAYFLPIYRVLNISILTPNEFTISVVGLSFFTLCNQQQVFFYNCFRSDGNATHGTYWIVALRFLDLVIQVAVSYFAGVVGLVLGLCAWRFIATWLMIRSLRRKLPWLELSFQRASFSKVRELLPLGMSFMAFPIGNAIIGQGMILLASVFMGPLAAVVLSTHRTLVNVSTQFMNTINYAFWPELTIAYAQKNLDLVRSLHRYACRFSIWGAVIISSVLFLNASWLIPLWTRNKIEPDLTLLVILLVGNLIRTLWFTSSVVAISTNQHSSNAKTYLLTSIASLGLIVLLFSVQTPSLILLGAAIVPFEIVMFLAVIRQSLAVTEDHLYPLLKFLLIPPLEFSKLRSRLVSRTKAL